MEADVEAMEVGKAARIELTEAFVKEFALLIDHLLVYK